MPTFIDTVGKFDGFPTMGIPTFGNDIVWSVAKNTFSSEIIEGLKNYHRCTPSLSTLYESVCEYNKKPAPNGKDKSTAAAFEMARKAFKLRSKCKLLHLDDMTPDILPSSTSPCLPYTRMGLKTKSQAWPYAMHDAKRYFKCISEEISCKLPPTMVFAKGKVCFRWENKTRAVWGKSMSLLLMEAVFAKGLWNGYIDQETPAGYRFHNFRGSFRKLHSELFDRMGFKTYLGLDFSKYDTSLPPWLINMAFSILEENIDFESFTSGEKSNVQKVKRVWTRIKRTMIDTFFLMPDGWMFQKHTGVDSGSFVFQLIENICTYIIVTSSLLNQDISQDKIFVMGDDSVVSWRLQHKLDFDKLCAYILETYGVKVNTDKSFLTDDLSKVKFLGRSVGQGLPRRDTCSVVLSLLYSGNRVDTVVDVAQRCVALYYENAMTNNAAERFILSVWEKIPAEVRQMLENKDIAWPWKWVKKFRRLGIELPRCRLPTLDALFVLFSYSFEIKFK